VRGLVLRVTSLSLSLSLSLCVCFVSLSPWCRFEEPLANILTEQHRTVKAQIEQLRQRRAKQQALATDSKPACRRSLHPEPLVLDQLQKLQLQQQMQQVRFSQPEGLDRPLSPPHRFPIPPPSPGPWRCEAAVLSVAVYSNINSH